MVVTRTGGRCHTGTRGHQISLRHRRQGRDVCFWWTEAPEARGCHAATSNQILLAKAGHLAEQAGWEVSSASVGGARSHTVLSGLRAPSHQLPASSPPLACHSAGATVLCPPVVGVCWCHFFVTF